MVFKKRQEILDVGHIEGAATQGIEWFMTVCVIISWNGVEINQFAEMV